MKFNLIIRIFTTTLLLALGFTNAAAATMSAQQLREQFNQQVRGKTIVFVPVSYALPLTRIWGQTMQAEAQALGIHFKIRDPNFNVRREVQVVSAMVALKPDVLVVHNPNVQVLANALKAVQKAGTYVIQVNMASRFKTDAYVGVNAHVMGLKIAKGVVETCLADGARSHKVAIMQGELTSAYNIGIAEAIQSVFAEHPEIDVVSNQAANWISKVAHDKAMVVLQAHPDLCAYLGFWSGQDVGIAQAVRQAGLKGKVKIFTSGGSEPPVCEYIRKGLIYRSYSYQAEAQAHQIMAIAKFLLQSGMPPGSFHTAIYSPITVLSTETVGQDSCTQVK
ncbi:MAG: sugar ABC transporter substrate-binding protein [Salinisphaera sp.]|nr:sugar ABC transporter substrate-binding protein [Salinisphaera sp.]